MSDEAKSQGRGWYIFYGMFLLVAGVFLLWMPLAASLATTLVLGVFFIAAAVMRFVHAFKTKALGRFLLNFLAAILNLLVGLFLVASPVEGMIAVTAVLAILLIAEGFVTLFAAIAWRPIRWGWLVVDGLLSILVGVIIWRHLPQDAVWVLGLLLSAKFIWQGIMDISLQVPPPAQEQPIEQKR